MAFGLTIGTERATALQNAIQDELTKRGYSPDADPVMAEYITIMIINNKTAAQISSELEDLIGSDFDPTFVDWLFIEAAKGAPESEAPAPAPAPAPEPSTSTQPRTSPPQPPVNVSQRLPAGPRGGAPLYQQAINQAIPSTSPTAQKRAASARSPSPSGRDHKSRRTDVPTGPRAMFRDGPGPHHGGQRSLLERMGGPQRGPNDDIQVRINNITGQDPAMMMMGPGFPMGGIPGMDMGAMANPMMLQEVLMNQMALMSQMAGAMGIMGNNGQLMNPAFGMQPGIGGDMAMANAMNNVQQGGDAGRGRRGRGGHPGRGGARGRGGQPGGAQAPAPDGAAQAFHAQSPGLSVIAPTPTVAIAAPSPVPVSATPSSSSVTGRTGFVAPERPQSPTLCKFGLKCSNPLCRYSHPSPVATPESGVVLSNEACENGKNCKDKDCIKAHVSPAALNPKAESLRPTPYTPPAQHNPHSQTPCRFGTACTRPGCPYLHPQKSHAVPCRFGTACTRASCTYQHPEGRVLPSAFHRGLSATGPLVNVPTPETGSIGAQSHNKSVTFNKANSAADLEKKVKEMEEKKSQAQKAVADAQAAAAGKKEDSSKPVIAAA